MTKTKAKITGQKLKVRKLPNTPGVYIFKGGGGRVIYVGKAARLRSRVASYFRNKISDPKTGQLVKSIKKIEHITTPGEYEALFLEAELIKRYKPKYNVSWQDEKNFLHVKVRLKDDFPTVEFVRRPLDDGATYLGPFIDAGAIKSSLRMLRRAFPYHLHKVMPKRACLDYHLGLCAGPEVGAVTRTEYRQMIRRLIRVLSGSEARVVAEIARAMKKAAKAKEFEKAAKIRDQWKDLMAARRKVIFSDRESQLLSADDALSELAQILNLPGPPGRIEAYDISHLSGKETVGSMIVFEEGLPKRDDYRHFKIRGAAGADDYKSLAEVLSRRLAKPGWPLPDLMVIDGGKGQLSTALNIIRKSDFLIRKSDFLRKFQVIGLAKREEIIFTYDEKRHFAEIRLPHRSDALKLLQRIRDEAHRFATVYHSLLMAKRATASRLDSIPGIGAVTRKKLIRSFGSVAGVSSANTAELVSIVGQKKANLIKEHLL